MKVIESINKESNFDYISSLINKSLLNSKEVKGNNFLLFKKDEGRYSSAALYDYDFHKTKFFIPVFIDLKTNSFFLNPREIKHIGYASFIGFLDLNKLRESPDLNSDIESLFEYIKRFFYNAYKRYEMIYLSEYEMTYNLSKKSVKKRNDFSIKKNLPKKLSFGEFIFSGPTEVPCPKRGTRKNIERILTSQTFRETVLIQSLYTHSLISPPSFKDYLFNTVFTEKIEDKFLSELFDNDKLFSYTYSPHKLFSKREKELFQKKIGEVSRNELIIYLVNIENIRMAYRDNKTIKLGNSDSLINMFFYLLRNCFTLISVLPKIIINKI